ncbi:MAG: OB-fold nucleic acid binding domain-containing protein, partial [Promicromonosporaceae bacterium]|nr:OB-fold nucleic acid binding domain-containing protein [Promicromonosporaceae bacterium]
ALLLIHELAIDEVIATKRQEAEGIFDLFSGFDTAVPTTGVTIKVPETPDWDKSTKLAFEREMLGLYVSDHPLAGLELVLENASDTTIAALSQSGSEVADNTQVKLAGLISSVNVRVSKNGNPYAIIELEDMTGTIEVSFFADAYLKFGHALEADAIISVSGTLQRRDETASIRAKEMSLPDTTVVVDSPVVVTLPPNRVNEQTLSRLRNILADHKGTAPVHVIVMENGKKTTVAANAALKVNKNPELYGDLQAALGVNCLAGRP